FGTYAAFARVEECNKGLVHIYEHTERHDIPPDQVVQVNTEVMIKFIDIDLERRRISLSLKQANEGFTPDSEFDPTQYGMAAEYDDQGNYIYPEGFDPETQEWQEGYDAQRIEWERQYSEAHARYEAHMRQVAEAQQDNDTAAQGGGDNDEEAEETDYRSGGGGGGSSAGEQSSQSSGGSLASDEQLAALREKLSGGA